MRKIPTIFVRDMSKQPALVVNEWHPDCGWVRDGAGRATLKDDGTCCMVRGGRLYKRRELRSGDSAPTDFESVGTDDVTGKTVGWVPVGDGPEDKHHREALAAFEYQPQDGTYELMGPKVQGNKESYATHILVPHGSRVPVVEPPREFSALREYLASFPHEGIVWHHSDGRMAKVKRKDFGLKW